MPTQSAGQYVHNANTSGREQEHWEDDYDQHDEYENQDIVDQAQMAQMAQEEVPYPEVEWDAEYVEVGVAFQQTIMLEKESNALNQKWLAEWYPDVEIRTRASPIQVRGIGAEKHSTDKYVLLPMNFVGNTPDGKPAIASFTREVSLEELLNARLLMGTDCIVPEQRRRQELGRFKSLNPLARVGELEKAWQPAASELAIVTKYHDEKHLLVSTQVLQEQNTTAHVEN
ncbi:hypothetical protein E4U58_002109 [Claviceps cyperi]|nr:hypothetical protein E4U58_002109 [Claviceps cyperi]